MNEVKMGHEGNRMRDKTAEMERRKDNTYIFITLHLDYLTTAFYDNKRNKYLIILFMN